MYWLIPFVVNLLKVGGSRMSARRGLRSGGLTRGKGDLAWDCVCITSYSLYLQYVCYSKYFYCWLGADRDPKGAGSMYVRFRLWIVPAEKREPDMTWPSPVWGLPDTLTSIPYLLPPTPSLHWLCSTLFSQSLPVFQPAHHHSLCTRASDLEPSWKPWARPF